MPDALGWRMKFGVIAPSTNTIVQPEFDAMRPEGVTNHFGRIHIPNDPLRSDDDFTRLIDTVRRGARGRNLALLGTSHEVLVEKVARRGDAVQARTRDFKTVLLPASEAVIGGYYTATLTGTTGSTFTGTVSLVNAASALKAVV